MAFLRSHAPVLLVLLFAALTSVAFVRQAEREPTISDQLGYLYAGERLAAGHGLTYEDDNNETAGPYFALYAFQIRREGSAAHYLGFPPGFPILLAAAAWMTGAPAAMHAVVPLLAAALLLVTYWLGKLMSEDPWVGLLSAVAMLATPAFWQYGTAAWSEIPAALTVALGVALFLASRKSERIVALSLAAAAVLSFGHFIRYTNVVFLAALAAYELYTARHRLWTERRRWVFWIATAAGLALIPLFNHVYYGGALVTSYSPAHGWYPLPAFSLAYALGPSFVDGYSLIASLRTLWNNFPVFLMLAPFGWWMLPAGSRVLTAAAVGFGLLAYVFYAFAPTGINARFLLPILPFIAVAIAQFVVTVLRRLDRPIVTGAVGLSLVIGLCFIIMAQRDTLLSRDANNRSVVALARELSAPLEANAVVMSYAYNDMIAIYGNRSVLNYRRIPASDSDLGRYRLEMLEPCLVGSTGRLLDQAIPVYYVADRQPSYWGSLEILERHFTLEAVRSDPTVYRVIERTGGPAGDESQCGFP